MSELRAQIVTTPKGRSVILYAEDGQIHSAPSSHPNFEQIVLGVAAGDPSVVELFDTALQLGERLSQVSNRCGVANGRLYFDGDELDNALARQILRFLRDDVEDWKPLVAFLEKVATNPNEHSKEQLFGFITANQITITQDGDIVCYKGVTSCDPNENEFGAAFRAKSSGKAMIDGTVFQGYTFNPIGGVITMPRSEVTHDPESHCSTGLHVATRSFAQTFAGMGLAGTGPVLEVHVNPRDVVSVPNDERDKIRVCRYFIEGVSDEEHTTPVILNVIEDDEYGSCEDCYLPAHECYCEDCDCDDDVCGYDGCPECGDRSYEDAVAEAIEASQRDEASRDEVPDLTLPDDCPECREEASRDEEDEALASSFLRTRNVLTEHGHPKDWTAPSVQKFGMLRAEAKLRKRGLERFLAQKGYKLRGDDPTDRENWEVPSNG